MMKICAVPKSAIVSFIFSGNAAQAKCCGGGVLLDMSHFEEQVFDVMTVLLPLLACVEHADIINLRWGMTNCKQKMNFYFRL